MAYSNKLVVLLLLNVLLVRAQDDCVCNTEETHTDQKAVFRFLEKVHLMGAGDKPVLPAVLGPLVECGNCLDRKKRTILPEVGEQFKTGGLDLRSIKYDARCPKNYMRLAYKCVHMSFLYDE